METPKRAAWILVGLAIYMAWGGFGDWFEILNFLGQPFDDIQMLSLPTYRQFGEAVGVAGSRIALNLGILGFCFATSWGAFNLFERHLRKSGIVTSDRRAAESQLLMQAIEDCGVSRIWTGRSSCGIKDQLYADNIIAAVKAAAKIRILSIACYEFLGRQEESLIHEVFSTHRFNPELELILLDPQNGDEIINQRIEVLKERDITYTTERMKTHIAYTIETAKALAKVGKNVSLWLTSMNPGFRLLIADDMMFVSAYTKRRHGHESHLFMINAKADASWFSAFEAYYDQVLRQSKRVQLA